MLPRMTKSLHRGHVLGFCAPAFAVCGALTFANSDPVRAARALPSDLLAGAVHHSSHAQAHTQPKRLLLNPTQLEKVDNGTEQPCAGRDSALMKADKRRTNVSLRIALRVRRTAHFEWRSRFGSGRYITPDILVIPSLRSCIVHAEEILK